MTDREKLIELLTKDPCYFEFRSCGTCKYHDIPACYPPRMADHLLANGVTFATDTNVGSKWISVEDEMPKTKKVINGEVYYRNVAVLTEDKVIPEKIAYYDEGIGLWFQPLDIFPLRNVTHWMPLPDSEQEEY